MAAVTKTRQELEVAFNRRLIKEGFLPTPELLVDLAIDALFVVDDNSGVALNHANAEITRYPRRSLVK